MNDQEELSDDEIEKKHKARVFCFVDETEIAEFDRSYLAMINDLRKQRTSIYIDDNNVLHYIHGAKWVHVGRDEEDGPSLHTLSTEWTIPFRALADNDLTLLETCLIKTVDALCAQFAHSIYSIVGAAAEKIGNVVSTNETGSNAQSFLEMLKRIEFGVDRNGNVSLPQLHVGPEMADKLLAELKAQPPEFGEEVERVKAERTELALRKEAERKAKFKAIA